MYFDVFCWIVSRYKLDIIPHKISIKMVLYECSWSTNHVVLIEIENSNWSFYSNQASSLMDINNRGSCCIFIILMHLWYLLCNTINEMSYVVIHTYLYMHISSIRIIHLYIYARVLISKNLVHILERSWVRKRAKYNILQKTQLSIT